jgi:hypothetical protein
LWGVEALTAYTDFIQTFKLEADPELVAKSSSYIKEAGLTYTIGRTVNVLQSETERSSKRRKLNEAMAVLESTGGCAEDLDKVLADQIQKGLRV